MERLRKEGKDVQPNVEIVTHRSLPDGVFQTKEDYPCLRRVTVAPGVSFAERKDELIRDAVAIVVCPGGPG